MRLFIDSSVALAACGRPRGASRQIFNAASANGWDLVSSGYSVAEFSDLAAQAQTFVEDSTVFAMINYTGTWNTGLVTYNGQPLADGSRFSVGSQLWEIDYDFVGTVTEPLNFRNSYVPASGMQTFVTVTADPEPATLALLAAAAGLAASARRRK